LENTEICAVITAHARVLAPTPAATLRLLAILEAQGVFRAEAAEADPNLVLLNLDHSSRFRRRASISVGGSAEALTAV
jgi:hypothetical protein